MVRIPLARRPLGARSLTWLERPALVLVMAIAMVTGISGPAGAQTALDGPGTLSHFGVARKDCLGTARNTTSDVWYTVANGVLSDVYHPTADTTNVETLQYIVTDGATFTDLQTRDMTYTVEAADAGGMECRVITTARSGAYQIVTRYVTDPESDTLLLRVRFKPQVPGLQLYVRLDPSVNGNGGGGSGNGGADSALVDTSAGHLVPVAFDVATETNAANRDYAEPVFLALDASRPFTQATVGFVGAGSDGLVQLDTSRSLTSTFTEANGGNVAMTARIGMPDQGGAVTLALGFGATQTQAISAADDSLNARFHQVQQSYRKGWRGYDDALARPPASLPGLTKKRVKELQDLYYLSANLIKASEDKSFPGAIVKSLSSPWGQALSAGDPANTFFGSYREVFSRDVYQAFTGLVAAGDDATARNAVQFIFGRQQLADGSIPRNSLLNGKPAPDTGGTQLDETAYPILMADQLGMKSAELYQQHVERAADFLIAHGPSSGVERWEEQAGFSPSTIAAEIAGLVAAAHLAQLNGDATSAQIFLGVADDFQRKVKAWTVTTTGSLSAQPYFIRLSKTGDPDAAISYNLGNGGPTLDQRTVVDAGFLELSRLGVLSATDVDVADSLSVIDAQLQSMTPSGPGWHRYSGDGFGDQAVTGSPWAPSGKGSGHVWPLLNAERAAQALQTGDMSGAAGLLDAVGRFAGGLGLIPEQDWELDDLAASPFGTDPQTASIGFTSGQPDGSASPLTWSAAAFVRMLADLRAGTLLDRPEATFARYVAHSQGQTSLTVTGPADESAIDTGLVTLTGMTAPGNTVYVAATNVDTTFATTTASTMANSDGTFSLSLSVSGGTTVLNTVAVSGSGATAHDRRAVVFDFTPGTVLMDVSDPDGDDNGPGNYAYPTSFDFHAGAYDIEAFRVIVSTDGATTTFKLRVRDLSPTFGSPLGAQLIDVYVHDPTAAAAETSTASASPLRNYVIDPASAWSRLLEVQGFGQAYLDAFGNSAGVIAISANATSRFITFSVPTASLGGMPGSGWGFTVTLTGQDGFSPDQARAFAPTPQPFLFGVCAAASADPHCTANPATVPKLIDLLTPPGVSQADEVDYVLHNPVTLRGSFIP